MEEINYKQLFEDSQAEVEKLRIRIAKGWRPALAPLDPIQSLLACFNQLSYLEKVYTVSVVVIAGSILIGQIRDMFRKEARHE